VRAISFLYIYFGNKVVGAWPRHRAMAATGIEILWSWGDKILLVLSLRYGAKRAKITRPRRRAMAATGIGMCCPFRASCDTCAGVCVCVR